MKELSIEQKARNYDDAIERARKEYKDHEAFNSFRNMLVRIFPELRENENEDDLEKEIELVKGDYEQVDVAWNNDFDFIARHFYELGLKTK